MIGSLKLFIVILAVAAMMATAKKQDDKSIGVQESLKLFRSESTEFAVSTTRLKGAILALDRNDPKTVNMAIAALKESRICYKRIESVMEYFFVNSARIYNRAPKNEIEEPYLEYQKPIGLQYIESLLFEENPASRKKDLIEQINILENSAGDLNSLLYQFQPTDNQILESQRIELIRIIALGIAGFDAPLLKTGIDESFEALRHTANALTPYMSKLHADDSLSYYLDRSLSFLKQNPDFDSFDRLTFLTQHALPLQKHLGKFISMLGLNLNSAGVLNYEADNLFSPNAFEGQVFDPNSNRHEILLGKKLFSDPSLSGNGTMSCASCHAPAKFFQDGLEKSIGSDGKSQVKRNAPSLLYASYQHSQFWDGRERTLEAQIGNVMHDPLEMNGVNDAIVFRLKKNRQYKRLFKKAFPSDAASSMTVENIQNAIASFVRTLHPYNSGFDQYLQGNKKAMTTSQMVGFNLFMGKGQCGTCHFAPIFNGLIPPMYKFTEFEILGTPLTDNLASPQDDPDQGRFHFRPIIYYKGAFKTPTVRNSAVTGPYMHNGAFNSLDSLMEFYNKGGGSGLGLDLPNQTLSSKPLNLSETEKKDIINFLHALTDQIITSK